MLIGHHEGSFNPWTEYDQFQLIERKAEHFLVVGAGADFSQASANDLLVHSADIQFNTPCGFSQLMQLTTGNLPIHPHQPGRAAWALLRQQLF